MRTLLLLLLIVSNLSILSGALMKIMHWPYANLMLYSGIIMFAVRMVIPLIFKSGNGMPMSDILDQDEANAD